MDYRRKWTEKDLAKMAQLRAEGKTFDEIGWAFGGISPQHVAYLLRRAKQDRLKAWFKSLPVGTVLDFERGTVTYPSEGRKSGVT
ncbi:MAG TPA: hypothetical protein G4O03_00675 [Dehalococcoidia bacterium]|jgi:hypothetical protein|nr:hypothetical protein [Dehalococcoidia bacterium]